MTRLRLFALLLSSVLFIACGGEKKKEEEKESIKIGTQKKQEIKDDSKIAVSITGNDMMKFNKSEIRVKEGQEVTLTLTHVGQMSKQVMGHNFVILKPGIEIQAFSLQATEAGEASDWIPNDGMDAIAHTKMLGGGESTTITFPAPPKGSYDFICSFPGHSALMRGKFIVE